MLGNAELFLQKWLSGTEMPVVCGVSGGPDSMALLDVMVASGVPVIVAHVDHMLRENSADDLEFVCKKTSAMGLPFFSTTIDVTELAFERKLSIEQAGREARYKFLFSVAAEQCAQAVIVGHSADDQVETFLMHLLRGSGSDGLRGMLGFVLPNEWSKTIPLLRPLLEVWRIDILRYCEERKIAFRVDQSNEDLRYLRNQIRHKILPDFQQINPNIKSTIWKTAHILGDEAEYLENLIDVVWPEAVQHTGMEFVRIARKVVLALPVALQRRFWRRAFATLHGPAGINHNMIEWAVHLTNSPKTTGKFNLGGGLVLYLTSHQVWLASSHVDIEDPDWPLCVDCVALKFEAPRTIRLSGSWSIQAEWFMTGNAGEIIVPQKSEFQAWFQGIDPHAEMTLRCRKPGDRFFPFGLGGHSKKLAEYMLDAKIPAPARDRWPVICIGETILWLPGCARSDFYPVKNESDPILCLTLIRS
jgi:tRNA(Ile)-lysidine synthase